MTQIPRLLFCCFCLLAAGACASTGGPDVQQPASPPLVRSFSDGELVKILEEMGFGSVTIPDKNVIKFVMEGNHILLINKEDGDLQLFYGVRGGRWSCEAINEWNRTHRLSRAYLDDDGDPILESDLLSNAGVSVQKVKEFVKVFAISRAAFEDFLRQTNRE